MDIQIGTADLNLKHKIRLNEDHEAPLVYLIHGRAGSFDVMWTFANLFPKEWNAIAPQADVSDPVLPLFPNGLSWWSMESDLKPYERAAVAAAKLAQFIKDAEFQYELEPRRRIAFGFSQGAALLSYVIQTNPELFEKVALLAGFVVRADTPQIQAKLPKVYMAHGTKDEVVSYEKSKEGLAYLQEKGFEVSYKVEDVGHKVGAGALRELREWVK